MRINRGFIGWGIFFILVGAVPLAVTAGYLTTAQVEDWWSLWPLILIGIGVGLLLRRTPFEFLGGLIVAATFGLIVGSVAAAGFGGVRIGGCTGEPGTGTPFAAQSGQLAGSASVNVNLNCGRVTTSVGQGTGWSLEGSSEDGQPPEIASSLGGLRIESRDRTVVGFAAAQDDWRLTLPSGVPLALAVEVNAGAGDLTLAGASLSRVRVGLNAGSVSLDLTDAVSISELDVGLNAGSTSITLPRLSMRGSIEANAGSVELCAPSDVGLRLRTGDNPLASYDYGDNGLVQTGNTWTSPGYESAAVKIDLETQGNAASFTLNPEDGCDG